MWRAARIPHAETGVEEGRVLPSVPRTLNMELAHLHKLGFRAKSLIYQIFVFWRRFSCVFECI